MNIYFLFFIFCFYVLSLSLVIIQALSPTCLEFFKFSTLIRNFYGSRIIGTKLLPKSNNAILYVNKIMKVLSKKNKIMKKFSMT